VDGRKLETIIDLVIIWNEHGQIFNKLIN
jgi:hypothetical protein